MPGISTSTVSPFSIGPTPAGVPVRTTSPGSRVIASVMKASSSAAPRMRREVLLRCFSSPFSRVMTVRLAGSSPVTIRGPMGAKPPPSGCPRR